VVSPSVQHIERRFTQRRHAQHYLVFWVMRMRLHYFSKTGEDSRGLEGTPGDSNRRDNSNVFTQ
jgi:hypothetical protein